LVLGGFVSKPSGMERARHSRAAGPASEGVTRRQSHNSMRGWCGGLRLRL